MSADRGPDWPEDPRIERTREAGRSAAQVVRESAVAGLTVLVPILITLVVFQTVAGYVVGLIALPVEVLDRLGLTPEASRLVVQAFVALVLAGLVLAVGFLTRFRYGERAIDRVDAVVTAVPGFGAVYKSFREMGDVMAESEAKNFRDVKVEFPDEGTYTMGFLTTRTPDPLQEAAGRSDMVTLFLPLAPNPVMGGHLVHVPEDRVKDVDMTVEEGVRTVVTSGVATASPDGERGLSEDRLRRIGEAGATRSGEGGVSVPDDRSQRPGTDADRERAYERYAAADPRSADHPEGVASNRSTDTLGEAGRPEDAGGDRPVSDGDPDPRPVDVRDGEGVIGRDAPDPEAVSEDHDDTLGRDADRPETVGGHDEPGESDIDGRPDAGDGA